MPGNMFLIPMLTSDNSARLMQRCRSDNFSALPFSGTCLAGHEKGSPQWQHTFYHEKKSPVSLRAGTGAGRFPRHLQLRLRQKTRAGH
jgi:hypothetical protein